VRSSKRRLDLVIVATAPNPPSNFTSIRSVRSELTNEKKKNYDKLSLNCPSKLWPIVFDGENMTMKYEVLVPPSPIFDAFYSTQMQLTLYWQYTRPWSRCNFTSTSFLQVHPVPVSFLLQLLCLFINKIGVSLSRFLCFCHLLVKLFQGRITVPVLVLASNIFLFYCE